MLMTTLSSLPLLWKRRCCSNTKEASGGDGSRAAAGDDGDWKAEAVLREEYGVWHRFGSMAVYWSFAIHNDRNNDSTQFMLTGQ
jgi:hypothetical protein